MLKGETSQGSKPLPYRPGLERPTLIQGSSARDENAGHERILANLEGRSPRTGMTTRSRRRLAWSSLAIIGIAVAAVGGYFYGLTSGEAHVAQLAVAAEKPVTTAVAMANTGAQNTAASAIAANVAPTAVIENLPAAPAQPAAATPTTNAAVTAKEAAASNAAANDAATAKPVTGVADDAAKKSDGGKKPAPAAQAKPSRAAARLAANGIRPKASATAAANARNGDKQGANGDTDVDLIEALIAHGLPSDGAPNASK